MAVCESLSAFALKTVHGRGDALLILGLAHAAEHTTDHSRRLLDVLEQSNRKAWRALEIALAGESLWTWFDREETKALRREIRAFVESIDFPDLAGPADYRARCLRELRAALGTGVLLGKLVAGDLAQRAGAFARHADPQAVLAAEKEALNGLGAEVTAAGFPALGALLARPAHAGQSVVVVAVRYFFRREIERNPQLFQGLQFSATEALAEAQRAGFDRLAECLEESNTHLDAALDAVAGRVVAEVREVGAGVRQVADSVRGVQDSVAGVQDSVDLVFDSVRGVQDRVADIHLSVEQATAAAGNSTTSRAGWPPSSKSSTCSTSRSSPSTACRSAPTASGTW
jgi:uncharacterized protein YoxC